MTTDLNTDLQTRWVPSPTQVAKADEALTALPVLKNVYTLHLLVNKQPHFWTEDIVVEYLPGVFWTRNDALEVLDTLAKAYHDTTGLPVVGGWTVHHADSNWAVFDDILATYPKAVR